MEINLKTLKIGRVGQNHDHNRPPFSKTLANPNEPSPIANNELLEQFKTVLFLIKRFEVLVILSEYIQFNFNHCFFLLFKHKKLKIY